MKVEDKAKQQLQAKLYKLKKLFKQERTSRIFENSPSYHISDLVDLSLLNQLMDSFYIATKIPYGIIDNHNNVLMGKGWQDICTQFHRVCPQANERCLKSDSYIFTHHEGESYIGYKCLNGLMDYVAPIVVEGQYLAGIYSGQFFHEPPDEALFRQQAKEWGLDEESYLEALSRVPIVSEEDIEFIMEFYSKLGLILANMGLERLRQIESTNQTIREKEESYKLILEASTDGYWHWDIEADQVLVSAQLAALFGFPAEEMMINFNTWKAFVHPHDINTTLTRLYEHLDAKTPRFWVEHRIMTRTGKYLWVLSRGKVIARDHRGRPLRMANTCFDISERKQTETALRLSEDKFSKAFNASPDTMSISTLEDGRMIAVNDSFCLSQGYNREEVVGRTSVDIGFWRDEFPRTQILKGLQTQMSVRDLEIHFFNSSGDVRLGSYSGERLEINGIPCILSVLKDITEQKKMEADMLRMDRLNLVGEMAASIGHEIRNPMTSIRGFLQIFREKYREDHEFLNIMIGELDRANSIISEFLSLAKNKMVELKPLRLTSLLKNIYPLLQANAAIQDKSVVLEVYDVPNLLLDEKEMRQLLLNLVYNGLEAMGAGGTLTIKAYVEGKHVVLSVHDQGKGINDDVLCKLGTPFVTTKVNGTGLGLPICYGIAARHNARIEVETGSDGTNFLVYFPRSAE